EILEGRVVLRDAVRGQDFLGARIVAAIPRADSDGLALQVGIGRDALVGDQAIDQRVYRDPGDDALVVAAVLELAGILVGVHEIRKEAAAGLDAVGGHALDVADRDALADGAVDL